MTEPPVSDPANDPARSRFLVIQLIRLGGVAFVLLGLVIWHGDLLTPGGDMLIGLPLVIVGVLDATVIPQLLARRWRTPRQ